MTQACSAVTYWNPSDNPFSLDSGQPMLCIARGSAACSTLYGESNNILLSKVEGPAGPPATGPATTGILIPVRELKKGIGGNKVGERKPRVK